MRRRASGLSCEEQRNSCRKRTVGVSVSTSGEGLLVSTSQVSVSFQVRKISATKIHPLPASPALRPAACKLQSCFWCVLRPRGFGWQVPEGVRPAHMNLPLCAIKVPQHSHSPVQLTGSGGGGDVVSSGGHLLVSASGL